MFLHKFESENTFRHFRNGERSQQNYYIKLYLLSLVIALFLTLYKLISPFMLANDNHIPKHLPYKIKSSRQNYISFETI